MTKHPQDLTYKVKAILLVLSAIFAIPALLLVSSWFSTGKTPDASATLAIVFLGLLAALCWLFASGKIQVYRHFDEKMTGIVRPVYAGDPAYQELEDFFRLNSSPLRR